MRTTSEIVKLAYQSWLKYLGDYLTEAGQKFIYQIPADRFNDGTPFNIKHDFLILSPLSRYENNPGEGSLELVFQIAVVTTQGPDASLEAFNKNFELQEIVNSALFSSERRARGRSAGGKVLYSIPLFEFGEGGEPTPVHDLKLLYEAAPWNDRSPFGLRTKQWAIQINSIVE
jgi:hypothetical protein